MNSFTTINGSIILLLSLTFSTHLFAQESKTELFEFSLTRMENQVAIDWMVEKEANTSFYEVQRSNNGYVFQTIARIESKAPDLSENSYEIVDKNPPLGKVQYRIKQHSQGNTVQVFETLSLDMGRRGNEMEISNLRVKKQGLHFHLLNPHSSHLLVQITSLSGQVIAERKEGSGQRNVDISIPLYSLSSGMYVVSVRDQEGTLVKEKFLY